MFMYLFETIASPQGSSSLFFKTLTKICTNSFTFSYSSTSALSSKDVCDPAYRILSTADQLLNFFNQSFSLLI